MLYDMRCSVMMCYVMAWHVVLCVGMLRSAMLSYDVVCNCKLG